MARKSKEQMKCVKAESPVINRVAIYIRLSGEDLRHTNNTKTLEDQEMLVRMYVCNTLKMDIYKVYKDNGVTGTTFNRDGFREMLDDMKAGKFNCIVVKDVSRFGRNHIEAAYYLYKVFPEYNIRFISINDEYDSSVTDETTESLIIPIKNLINENYSRDISKKVAAAKKLNIEKGLFMQKFTPFGYKKDPDKKGHLIIDEDVSWIVVYIFDFFLNSTQSLIEIARKLNKENIISPAKYKYDLGLSKAKKWENAMWTSESVRNILMNPIYTGCMVMGKHGSTMCERITKDKSEWKFIPNMHDAIISEEKFKKVESLLNVGGKVSTKYPKAQNTRKLMLFSKMYCGFCGTKLTFHYEKNSAGQLLYPSYYCPTRYRGKVDACPGNRIYQNVLEKIVVEVLKRYVFVACSFDAVHLETLKNEKISLYEQMIKSLKSEIAKANSKKTILFDELIDEKITDKEYEIIHEAYDCEISSKEEQIIRLTDEISSYKRKKDEQLSCLKKLASMKGKDKLSKEVIDTFIEKIILYGKDKADIIFKFSSVFDDLESEYGRAENL